MRVVVLAVGNLLLGDEGVGVRVVQHIGDRCELPPGVSVVDASVCGMEMLNELCGAAHLVIVGALHAGAAPGSILRLDDEEVPRFFAANLSPHQIALSDTLAALALMGEKPRITLLGVQPESTALGTELSPTVEPVVRQLVELVRAELDRDGLPLRDREPR